MGAGRERGRSGEREASHKQGRKSKGLQPGQNRTAVAKAPLWVSHFGGWSQPWGPGAARQPKTLLLQEWVQPCASTQHRLF